MGQITRALIEHRLTPEEIFELPERLKAASNTNIAGQWCWDNPNYDITLLKHYWEIQLPPDFSNPWSEVDFPWLKKDEFTLDFSEPNLIQFDNLTTWFWFSDNDAKINYFSKLTCEIAMLVKAIDMIFIPEISDDFVQQHEKLTVDLFRRNCVATKQPFLEVRRNIV